VQPTPERAFSSTTWAWRRVKIAHPPEAMGAVARRASFWRRFPTRDPREPITVKIKLRGGPECWVEVHARGSIGRYPGATAVYDILADINNLRR
jgi:hypothetical protein